MLRKLKKIIQWCVICFIVLSVSGVLFYKWVPVYITPLMIYRYISPARKEKNSHHIYHQWISLHDMSPYMPVAVIAAEDAHFMRHHGFDSEAIYYAIEENMEGKRKLGGSTISQQTAKNIFLLPIHSYIRKGIEAYFTCLIELFWSKQRIMEVYLNSIEMGEGVFGIQAVARKHFECNASQLTKRDCALIAATLPNPIKYNSAHPSEYMLKRKNKILKEMHFVHPFKMVNQ